MKVLAGDIGGTHARLAIVDVADGRATVAYEHVVSSPSVSGLAELVKQFRWSAPMDGVDRACLAIAAASMDGVWRPPNLPWEIRSATAPADTGIPATTVINDFDALGHSLAVLGADDLATLQAGEPDPSGPKALIGPGTGLGMSLVLPDSAGGSVHPSEGGHADFAPRTPIECDLLTFLRGRHQRVSTERILSGSGLAALYDFAVQRGEHAELPATTTEMKKEDAAAVVTRHAVAGDDPLCVMALDLFLNAFGAAAGNLALTVLATGGVYLGGGIAPRLEESLRDGPFLAAFAAKGRLAPLLARVPIHLIRTPNAGLLGAASVAATG